MYCPDSDEVSKAQLILEISIPEPYGQYTSVVSKHDPDVALRSSVSFTWLSHIVEVDYASHEHKITRTWLKITQIGFIVIYCGLSKSV